MSRVVPAADVGRAEGVASGISRKRNARDASRNLVIVTKFLEQHTSGSQKPIMSLLRQLNEIASLPKPLIRWRRSTGPATAITGQTPLR